MKRVAHPTERYARPEVRAGDDELVIVRMPIRGIDTTMKVHNATEIAITVRIWQTRWPRTMQSRIAGLEQKIKVGRHHTGDSPSGRKIEQHPMGVEFHVWLRSDGICHRCANIRNLEFLFKQSEHPVRGDKATNPPAPDRGRAPAPTRRGRGYPALRPSSQSPCARDQQSLGGVPFLGLHPRHKRELPGRSRARREVRQECLVRPQ